MKTKLLIPIIATLCGPASFALAQDIDSAPPVVIKTIPEAGTKDVPPGEYEIQVTFSKDMADQSWSWSTAWENSTPEMVGKPHYTDDHRTCVLKVNLEPGKTYGWWLNSQRFHGFRDAQNHAAVPYLLTFATGTTAAVATGNSSAAAAGWQLWQSHDYEGAAAKFREAVAASPDDANSWNGLGWALFNGGKAGDAIEPFQKAIALQADHPAALNGLGQIYLSERKYDDAEKYLLKAAPKAPAAWYGLARLYLLEGKYSDAEHWAQNIVDAGQADETVKKMLEAAQKKNLSEGLRLLIEPPATEPSDQTAMPAVQSWLALIDKGDYAKSWENASAYFRTAVTSEQWVSSLKSLREPLGDLKSRELQSEQRLTKMPGAPDGQYVLMEFETSFSNKQSAIETLVFSLEKDGQWRASGYYIK